MNESQTKFSVLLTVYYKEKAEYFDECLDSLRKQTVKADEWVIVKDGPLTPELEDIITKYKQFDDVTIKEVVLAENKGSGIASSVGIIECKNELVARMDSDDIAVPNRFELQLQAFEENPNLDVCGGQILEFENDPAEPIAERRVPLTHTEIYEYHKMRSAFNNMTVMYKRSKVLQSGNFRDAPLMEDYVVYVDLLMHGAICMNLDEYLCYARTNRDMVSRRGGYKNYKKFKKARKVVYDIGFISYWQYAKFNLIQFVVCMMPVKFRRYVFFNLLHKKVILDNKESNENAGEI